MREREDAQAASSAAKERRTAELLASKTPEDVAMAGIAKLATQSATKHRCVSLAEHEINAAAISDDERRLLLARQAHLLIELDKMNKHLVNLQAQKTATAEHLNNELKTATDELEELHGLWMSISRLVPSAKSKPRGKAKASGKLSV